MTNKRKQRNNVEMCEEVTLRCKTRVQATRIKELEKMLSRSMREIETLSAQYDDNGSAYLINKIKSVLEEK